MESPGALLLRLSEIPGYEWQTDKEPFHSSYDNWHFFGTQHVTLESSDAASSSRNSLSSRAGEGRPNLRANKSSNSEISLSSSTSTATRKVVARVSRHILRLEREFQLAQQVTRNSDPDCKHFVRPLELIRLPSRHGGEPLIVSTFEAPGRNYLRELVEFGPNAYRGIANRESWDLEALSLKAAGEIPLLLFLDFAIGAAECCEILHHGNRLVHGEIRGDAFFFDPTTGAVKMLNFGSGARSFENGLTSAGWYSLSRERGVEHKLQFIAPEQTGRLPAEPDSRTDIYSLGILFGYMLTGVPPFEGDTPLEIMQSVLSRRIPPVSSIRLDIPDALSRVIARMTNKNIEERYASATGLKHDLLQIQKLLSEGDMQGLKNFQIGSKDVSSFFHLPQKLIGRDVERRKLLDIIETVSRRQQFPPLKNTLYSISSSSSISDTRFESFHLDEAGSDSTSSRGSEKINGCPVSSLLESSRIPSRTLDSIPDSEHSSTEDFTVRPLHESKNPGDAKFGVSNSSSFPSIGKPSSTDGTAKLRRTTSRMRRKGR